MNDQLSDLELAEGLVAEVLEEFADVSWTEAADAIEDHILGGAAASSATGKGFVEELARHDSSVFDEPHLLGWIHQHLGTAARRATFRAHSKDEAKHADSIVATQIYTPRWVAEMLVCQALEGLEAPTVIDPACGGGQFLLAALDRMVGGGEDPLKVLGRLRGGDLDPTAVDAARRSLALHAFRLGASIERARDVVREHIVVADALDLEGSYDVVVTNPPYMGHRSMPDSMRQRLKESFRPFHLDLATAVIARCAEASTGSLAILSQQSIWFLKRFEDARRQLRRDFSLELFAHFGPHLFDLLKGEKASVVGFVMRRSGDDEDDGFRREEAIFHDLRDIGDAAAMRRAVVHDERRTVREMASVTRLPGAPVAHWLEPRLVDTFETASPLGERFEVPGSQNKTGRNRTYVRKVADVEGEAIASLDAASSDGARWRYYSKGGRYAPWWGNWDNLVDWSDDARQFYAQNRTSNLLDDRWIDRVGLVYTDFGGRTFNARWKPATALFDMAGPAIFHPEDDESELAALMVYLNSEPARALLNALNPTLHYQVRDVRLLPLPGFDANLDAAAELGSELVALTRGMVANDGALNAERIRELERRANALVCDAFGVEPVDALPRHWKLG